MWCLSPLPLVLTRVLEIRVAPGVVKKLNDLAAVELLRAEGELIQTNDEAGPTLDDILKGIDTESNFTLGFDGLKEMKDQV